MARASVYEKEMLARHITTVVGVSSFCLGIWFDRKYRAFSAQQKTPGLQIFDGVNADSIITNDLLLPTNEQRVSQVGKYQHL